MLGGPVQGGQVVDPGQGHDTGVAQVRILVLVGGEHVEEGGYGLGLTQFAQGQGGEVTDPGLGILQSLFQGGSGAFPGMLAQDFGGLGPHLRVRIFQQRNQGAEG